MCLDLALECWQSLFHIFSYVLRKKYGIYFAYKITHLVMRCFKSVSEEQFLSCRKQHLELQPVAHLVCVLSSVVL